MNPGYTLAAVLLALILSAAPRPAVQNNTTRPVAATAFIQNKRIVQCSPDWSALNEDSLAKGIGVLPGWGNYRWLISTKNDSAQFYFNQGISMYYAFHIIEAMASFKKAAEFDDRHAMIYWAQALAYGPNINDFEYAATPEAYAASQKALSLMGTCTAKEKALIKAMANRYSADSTASRDSLNQLYVRGLKNSYQQFPQDADIGALYADAMMLQHPWDYWKNGGTPQPWTPGIVKLLENVLLKHPLHPGANHYYIHMIEASPNPAKALASADRLGKLMPAVSHMVHMPSHIYIRTGDYRRGTQVNEMSIEGYNRFLTIYPDVKNNAFLYLLHNIHMQSACAMMMANYQYSARSAFECRQTVDTAFLSLPAPMGNYLQYVYMTEFINQVRFGKWDGILTEAPVQERYVYATVLWHWARGMAFAGKAQLVAAEKELKQMHEKMKTPDMMVVMQPFNAPNDAAIVAGKILAGVIAAKATHHQEAISLLTDAVKNEDAMIYTEPKDWLLPARQYLGNVLLDAGEAVKAEAVFRQDLAENPANHWSLCGLYKALRQQGKKAASLQVQKQYKKAFENADIPPGHVVF
jgi:tetratricopeptide (TPR) repeat protein